MALWQRLATCLLIVLVISTAWLLFVKTPSNQTRISTSSDTARPEKAFETVVSEPSNVRDASIVDFVGSAACRECHPEIWEKYQSHPMAHSFSKVMTAKSIEDYSEKTEFSPPGNRRYRVEKTPDRVLHHEIMVDQNREELYDQSVQIDYTFGSGKRGRGYVIDRGGLLFKSSISWFSDRKEWGLSPDYLPDNHRRFERRVTGGCLTCHCGLLNFVRNEADRFRTPTFFEEAISCERCHGPGRKHIEAREADDIASDPIVNPGKLDMDRREAVCAQCHLHGESRILLSGRMPHDFRPGERLEENWVTFVKSQGTGLTRSGRAASQVEHMVSSTCFKKSEGKLGCISCHDPHAIPTESEKPDYFRQRCLKCHSEGDCSEPLSVRQSEPHFDNCVHCHMPSVPAANVLHRSIADHRILRNAVIESDEKGKGDLVVFQFDQTLSIPPSQLVRARALKMMAEALGTPVKPEMAREANQLLEPLIDEYPEDTEILVALGNGCQIQNQWKEAEKWWLKVLSLNPRNEYTIQTLATIYQNRHENELAEKYLRQLIELNPWHGSFHGRLSNILMLRGEAKAAIAAAEKGLELNPTIWDLHELLSNAYARFGQQDEAKKHHDLFLRRPARVTSSESKP